MTGELEGGAGSRSAPPSPDEAGQRADYVGLPECAHGDCNDVVTARYWRGVATGSAPNRVVMFPASHPYGEPLCKPHAIEKYRVSRG